MYWRVTGSSGGREIVTTIRAETAEQAMIIAAQGGIVVTAVEPSAPPLPPREQVPLLQRRLPAVAVIGALVVVLALVGAVGGSLSAKHSAAVPAEPDERISIGDTVRLSLGANELCLLAVDDAASSELVRAITRKDAYMIADLVRDNRAFSAPGNARVYVHQRGAVMTTVRVLEGVTAGRIGIVSSDLLKK